MFPFATFRRSDRPARRGINLLVSGLLAALLGLCFASWVVAAPPTRTTGWETQADPGGHFDPANYCRASRLAHLAGQEARAISILEEGRQLAEPSAPLLVALGELYAAEGHWADAGAVTREALALDPAWVAAWIQLGRIQAESGAYGEALSSYRQALVHEVGNRQAQIGIGYCLLLSGQPAEAERSCREFLAGGHGHAELMVLLGESLEKQERFTEAFACYGQALIWDDRCAPAHSRRGRLYCRYGQYEAAALECRAALAIDPDSALASAYLAIASAHLEQDRTALVHGTRAQDAGLNMKPVWFKLVE